MTRAQIDHDDAVFGKDQFLETNDHSAWRRFMAEHIAKEAMQKKLGVDSMYLIGSVERYEAGPQSDIDILIRVSGKHGRQKPLKSWLAGWDRFLSRINFRRTGYFLEKILDAHIISDKDIADGDSFAIMIDDPFASSPLTGLP